MTSVHSAKYRTFLERLREARKASGLTQVEVAAKLDHPQSYVSKSESGERRIDVVELGEFAKLYHKPLSYFLP
jgi:transcriptional regulator with XRE-family HTH domain